MDKIRIKGVEPYDGEYEFDYSALTNRDARTIKQVAGLTIPELAAAIDRNDNDLFIAFAMIALRQNGVKPDEERFLDAPLGTSIEYVGEVDDAVPPPSESPSDTRTSSTRSGEPSQNGSENPAASPSRIGDPNSVIGAT